MIRHVLAGCVRAAERRLVDCNFYGAMVLPPGLTIAAAVGGSRVHTPCVH